MENKQSSILSKIIYSVKGILAIFGAPFLFFMKIESKVAKGFIALYFALSYLLVKVSLDSLKPMVQKNQADIERDKKYHAFKRNDIDKISHFQAYLLAPVVTLKWIFAWSQYAYAYVAIKILGLTKKEDEPFTGWQKAIMTRVISCAGWWIFRIAGITSFTNTKKKVDYSEYLGPDWEMTFEGYGTVIANHQTWMDIPIHQYMRIPSHVAKEGTKKLPFIGAICTGFSGLYVERENKGQKKTILEQIGERQLACERGEFPPLIIYPEGGTTNGEYLIQFKKGAFASLTSVAPVVINYDCPGPHVEGSNVPIYSNIAISGLCFNAGCTYLELPVFRPNDYFFKHHQKEGEEKWEAFARVIRDIMAKHGDLKLSDLQIEDKYKYKELIYKKFSTTSAKASD